MKFKKVIVMILAVQMLLAGFAGCTKAPGGEETKAPVNTPAETTPVETTPAETTFDRNSVSDGLPDVTFDGKDFRFLVDDQWVYQLYSEDTSGIGLDAAIYDRNQKVQDRFDVKIGILSSLDMLSYDKLVTYTNVGEHVAEICAYSQEGANTPTMSFAWTNLNDIPYLNFDQPWWNKESIDDYTFGGYTFNFSGDLALTSIQTAWCLAVNNNLLEDWGYTSEELYQLVWDGEWTLDKMIEMTSEQWNDVNGDGAADSNDIYGFGTPAKVASEGIIGGRANTYGTANVPWVTALGEQVLTQNETKDGFTITIGTEKLYGALEKLVNFHNNTKGVTMYADDTTFAAGKVGIYTTKLDYFYRYGSDIDFTIGLMPLPKYDADQENYSTLPDTFFTMFGVPVTLPLDDYDFVGIIMEVLNAESWKNVYPVYYDEALKGRYSTDANMAKMVDLIADSRKYEYASSCAQSFPNEAKLPQTFNILIEKNNTDLASVLAEYSDHIYLSCAQLMAFYNIVDKDLLGDPGEWYPGFKEYFGDTRFK